MWKRIERLVQLGVLGALLAGCGKQPRLTIEAPPRGTIRAQRDGQTVVVELGLENVPADTEVLTLGLMLGDDTPIYPRTIRPFDGPDADLAASARLDFELSDSGTVTTRPAAAVRPDRWIRLSYDLGPGVDGVAGGAFSLVLGDPDMAEGCRMGMTATIAARDGSPSLFSCLAPGDEGDGDGFPLPPLPATALPKASFRLAERPAPAGGGARIVPRQVAWTAVFPQRKVALLPDLPTGAAE